MKRYRKIIVALAVFIIALGAAGVYVMVTGDLHVENQMLTADMYQFLSVDTIYDNITEPVDASMITLQDETGTYSIADYRTRQIAAYNLTDVAEDVIPLDSSLTVYVKKGLKTGTFFIEAKDDTLKTLISVRHNGNAVQEKDTLVVSRDQDVLDELDISGYVLCFGQYQKSVAVSIETDYRFDIVGTYPISLISQEYDESVFEFSIQVKDEAAAEHVLIRDPDSELVWVSKTRYLPETYVPDLQDIPVAYALSEGYRARPVTVSAFSALADALFAETGLKIYTTSAYRSYASQANLYNNYVSQYGAEYANRMSARPGTSEHQTGLVIDVVAPGVSMFDFKETAQSAWILLNAHRFGFIVRYPEGKEAITGYMPEAWHLRYVGIASAEAIYQSGLTFDEWIVLP